MAITQKDIEAVIAATRFDGQGLVPVVAQDAGSGVVRMLAWANQEALRATAETGLATFYSRSRAALWQKGATSGNRMTVADLRVDCDGDVILYRVNAEGPSCHEGPTSCFFRHPEGGALVADDGPAGASTAIFARVAEVIAARRAQAPDKSYVASLLHKGFGKIAEKIREEAGELCEALPEPDRAHTTHEAADLIFHTMVGLEAAGIPLADVCKELERRFGTSGLVEKANRAPKAGA